MKNTVARILVLIIILTGIGLGATIPDKSLGRFVVLNDFSASKANAGAAFKLGPPSNPTLTLTKTVLTGGEGGSPLYTPGVVVIQEGMDICVYFSDAETADIAVFTYPTFGLVGRFFVPGVTYSGVGLGITARSNLLFASYSTQNDKQFIATWSIDAGCGLELVTTYNVPGSINGLAISPDGKTLVAGYDSPNPSVDSFSIGSDGTLIEHGPYAGGFDFPTGVDITADGKYALFGEVNGNDPAAGIQIGIYAVDIDGSLGTSSTFGNLGNGADAGYIWLSPNEKFLFVSSSGAGMPITTLNFDESLPQVTYTGCTVTLGGSPGGVATALPTGAGGLLYAGESTGDAKVALLTIDSATGCLTQVAGSPFASGTKGGAYSIAGWPLRPF